MNQPADKHREEAPDRNNYQERDDGLYVCYGNHERGEDCEWIKVEDSTNEGGGS